eukprot:TRINITY_DN59992_c0_g1_i1.p2 TRINITY_DN59992_c0_g1~~TRINITY_DN59992_c0_g1_i1.p2  ORF type:complete len:501 (+),score=42.80 TRINITY_DN59992_c0_g1_i1:35-1537(+)
MFKQLFLNLLLVSTVSAFSGGPGSCVAPLCPAMIRAVGVDGTLNSGFTGPLDGNYQITAPSTATEGDTVAITIARTSGTWKGFMLQCTNTAPPAGPPTQNWPENAADFPTTGSATGTTRVVGSFNAPTQANVAFVETCPDTNAAAPTNGILGHSASFADGDLFGVATAVGGSLTFQYNVPAGVPEVYCYMYGVDDEAGWYGAGPFISAQITVSAAIATCANSPCGANADCTDQANADRTCVCQRAFEGNPLTGCTAIAIADWTCTNVPCGANTNCVESNDGARACSCQSGFEGDAEVGCTLIPACTENPCGANTNCEELGNGNRACSCQPGFEGDAEAGCTAIVLACTAGQTPNNNNDACENCPIGTTSVGGQAPCTTCPPGTSAGVGAPSCQPCAIGTFQPESGKPSCMPCPTASAPAFTTCPPSSDPCVPFPCNANAMCNSASGSAVCVCKTGFVGNGVECLPKPAKKPAVNLIVNFYNDHEDSCGCNSGCGCAAGSK